MPKAPFKSRVFCGQEELIAGEHGYLGRLEPGTMRLQVECSKEGMIHAFVNQAKNVMPVKLRKDDSAQAKHFRANVHLVQPSSSDITVSRSVARSQVIPLYPNSLHLADFRSGGELNVWEVSLVAWRGHFYLKTQLLHTAQMYLNLTLNRMVCPYFEENSSRRWMQLIQYCQQHMDEKRVLLRLPDISDYRPVPKQMPKLCANEALVIFFSWARLFAVLRLSNGNCVVALTDQLPKQCNELPRLRVGEVVRWRSIERLPPRDKPSTFTHGAIGVSLVK